MSVETVGVKGYEYQYVATSYLSLQYIEKENLKILVENTEDAKIVFEENDTEVTLYLQAKQHAGDIALSDLCEWLIHFGERQAEEYLLSRIANDQRFAVFVSGGRCRDEVIKYCNKSDFTHGNASTFSWQTVEDVKHGLTACCKTGTKLAKERYTRVEEYCNAISPEKLRAALRRVSIAEQMPMEYLLEAISKKLNIQFAVRHSDVSTVLKLLDDVIRKGRDSGENIASEIKSIIKRYSQRLLPDGLDYIKVPEQEKLESLLLQNHALLLTGVPLCGKTTLAKSIAQSYAQQGYEVKQVSGFAETDGVFSFLGSSEADQRLLLLEDPFGAVTLSKSYVEILGSLRKILVGLCSPDRMVIVTTRTDLLLEAFGEKDIRDCSIGSHLWQDQTEKSESFYWDFWHRLYGEGKDSTEAFHKIYVTV